MIEENMINSKIKNFIFLIVTLVIIGLYIEIIFDQYQIYSWVDFPLGWDPILYLRGAMVLIERWNSHDFISRGVFNLYIYFIALLGLFLDVKKVEIFMPIILSIFYSCISAVFVFYYTKSRVFSLLSIFLTLFSMRNAQFLSLFHAQLLALILFILLIFVLIINDQNLIKLKPFLTIIIMLLLLLMTHIFTFCFVIFSSIFLYKLYIEYFKYFKRYILLGIIPIILLFLYYLKIGNIRHWFSILFQSRVTSETWYDKPKLIYYTEIYNGTAFGLILIVISTFYLAYKYKENIAMYFISIFSIISLMIPLSSAILPLTLPISRITMLCQYQIILPIFLNELNKLIKDRRIIIGLKTFNININIRILKQVFTIILILIIVMPSYNYFKNSVSLYLGPWINKDTYDRMIKTNVLIEEKEIENPVFVFHGSPGKANLLRSYARIVLGEHHGYYGSYEDALALTAPGNLTYLSLYELDVARKFYFGEEYGEREPLSELGSDEITIIIISPFYDLPVPPSYKSENGITIIDGAT